MTENEKYCGKGYVPKVNKGEVKQEQWIEKVQTAIEQSSSDPKLRNLLQRLQDYPNIPRKKAKFENFLKNSMRVLSPYLITQVWNVLMEQTQTANAKTENQETKPTEAPATNSSDLSSKNDAEKTNGVAEKTNGVHSTEENDQSAKLSKREKKEERSKKKNKKEKKDKPVLETTDEKENVKKTKKRKRDDSENNEVDESEILKKKKKKKKKSEESKEQSDPDYVDVSKEDGRLNDTLVSESPKKSDKFEWGTTILSLLEKKGEISYKKLRRKIMQEFMSQDGGNVQEESVQIKFDKKLRKMTQVVISDGRVSLR